MAIEAQSQPNYLKASFLMPAVLADEAAALLVERGALGCAVEGDQREAGGRSVTVRLQAYFRRLAPSGLRSIVRELGAEGILAGPEDATGIERIVDPGWSTIWMKEFKPLRVGRRFIVMPPWERTPAHGLRGRLPIVLRPGQAFGTGHHPTTRGALRALEALFASASYSRALDVGTGSGILAIAMKLLGAAQVSAIDIDRSALDCARKNAALNGLSRAIKFSAAPLASIRGCFDLVTANLLSSALIALAPRLCRLLRRDGRLVLGGILSSEARLVLKHYRPRLRLFDSGTERGWTTLVLGR